MKILVKPMAFLLLAFFVCGGYKKVNADPSVLPITWDNPFPDEQGLLRATGDSGLWVFAVQLENGIEFSQGPTWIYPLSTGTDPEWGDWNPVADYLTWSAPNSGEYFIVRVKGRIRRSDNGTGDGGGEAEEKDFEASWSGEVYVPISAHITQSDANPNPAPIGEEVTVNLAAELLTPPAVIYTEEPTWDWDILSVEYRANETESWSETTPAYTTTISWISGSPTASHVYTFSAAGQWRIRVQATAYFETTEYGSGPKNAQTFVGEVNTE